MDGSPPRHRVASVRAVITAIVGPIVAAVPIGRITVAVAIGRIAIAVTIGRVAVTVAVGRIVIAVGRPPQRRADQRADGEGAETKPPTTPAGLRRFRRAHGDCAGEQHGDQRSSHGLSSLVLHFVRARPLFLYRGTLSGNDCVVGPILLMTPKPTDASTPFPKFGPEQTEAMLGVQK